MGKDAAFCANNIAAVHATSSGAKELELRDLDCWRQRQKWIDDNGDYHKMFRNGSRQQATALYQRITNPASLPGDFIRRRFLSIALSAEAFLTMRAEFAQTLAVSNLFGYILGNFAITSCRFFFAQELVESDMF